MRKEKSYSILLGLIVAFVILLVCVCGFFSLFFGGQSFNVIHEQHDSISVDSVGEEAKDTEQ